MGLGRGLRILQSPRPLLTVVMVLAPANFLCARSPKGSNNVVSLFGSLDILTGIIVSDCGCMTVCFTGRARPVTCFVCSSMKLTTGVPESVSRRFVSKFSVHLCVFKKVIPNRSGCKILSKM